MDVVSISKEEELGEVIEDHSDTVIIEAVTEPVLVAVVDPFADPDQRLRPRVLSLVLEVRRLLARFAGDQILELVVEVGEIAVHGATVLALGAVLPHDASCVMASVIDLHQRRPPGDEALIGLGVKPWRHGETGHGQPRREVTHGHEVVLEDLRHAGPPARIVLQQLLDEVLGQGTNSAGDMIFVFLNPATIRLYLKNILIYFIEFKSQSVEIVTV